MKLPWKLCLILALLAFVGTTTARAQGVTTSAMTGVVTDSAGVPLGGVHVAAVHVPSGTAYSATTLTNGRFTIPGMRVGGPYRVTASMVGYRRQVQDNINLTLGVAADVSFVMGQVSVELEAITVSGVADPVFSSQRTGAATAVPVTQIEALPTIFRQVDDLLRLTPEYTSNGFGYSFAGQQDYFNNMTIDGSYFNNSFGLAGEPGQRTHVAAVSLDALEQIEVNVAPFDVRQGNFVGAGVNMVTKSGTNQFAGSLYYQFRNNNYVGTQAGANTFNPGTFKYHDLGLNLGGPIIPNKLFFFTSWEGDINTQPGTGFLANTGGQTVGGQTSRVLASDLDALSAFLATNFKYNTGPYQGYNFNTPSNRFLVRLDYNLNDRNKLSLRYNVLNSSSDINVSGSSSLGVGGRAPSLNALPFANSNYAILENIRSTVAEWNSTIGAKMSNNLIVGYTSNNESRRNIAPPWFPEVEILNNGVNYTTFGFEPFTPDNQLYYHSFQVQDNFNIYLPKQTLTFGFSLEQYHSKNVFFPGAQSVYVYKSLADFYTDANGYIANPSRTGPSPVTLQLFQYRYGNIPGQTEPVQPLTVLYGGVYAQDELRPTSNLTLTAGLRVDAPKFQNTAYDNTVADTMHFRDNNGNTVQYNSGALPPVNPLLSPRLGINYDLMGQHKTQIRGGTGVFSGRPAYVWVSNQVGNTGVLTGFISASNTTAYPFNPNNTAYAPPASAITGGPAQTFELNFTDKNFKFPQSWRTNLAVDQRLPFGLTGTAEWVYTRDMNGIGYMNVNLPAPESTFTGPDNRPRWYQRPGCVAPPGVTSCVGYRIYQNVSDAPVLTNEGVGHAWNLSFTIEKPLTSGFYGKVGYTYGRSFNTGDPGSIAYGNWTGITSSWDPNNPGLGYSSFTPGGRIFAALTYSRDFFGVGASAVSLFLNGQTWGNGSYVTSGDLNGDGVNGNDLIYVPRNQSEMNFDTLKIGSGASQVVYTPAQEAAAWDAFINQDPYLKTRRGQYAQRNAAFLPWVWRLDGSISQDLGRAIGGQQHRLQIRLDVLNLTNLINKDWGLGYTFTTTRPLNYKRVNASNQPVYTLAAIGTNMISSSYVRT
ncbi:MAG TPA: carboxypeptidase regulatory-like domain-containing protein, partial [Gemmatimonadales bacterium]|nr:carboxypeptidase regulatory-like domain-containing protein [Gemmatimonadales bacterium]